MKKITLVVMLSMLPFKTQANNLLSGELLQINTKHTTEKTGGATDSAKSARIGIRFAHHFSDYIAAEIGFNNYGGSEVSDIDSGEYYAEEVASWSMNIGVRPSYPVTDSLTVSVSVGLAMWNYDYEGVSLPVSGHIYEMSDSASDFYYGLAVQYKITPEFFISAGYMQFKMDFSDQRFFMNSQLKSTTFSVGAFL